MSYAEDEGIDCGPPDVTTWTMRDGRVIDIDKMGDLHLIRTLRMLERNAAAKAARAELEGYAALMSLHGEMAILSVEQDLAALAAGRIGPVAEMYDDPTYNALADEACARGLDWSAAPHIDITS